MEAERSRQRQRSHSTSTMASSGGGGGGGCYVEIVRYIAYLTNRAKRRVQRYWRRRKRRKRRRRGDVTTDSCTDPVSLRPGRRRQRNERRVRSRHIERLQVDDNSDDELRHQPSSFQDPGHSPTSEETSGLPDTVINASLNAGGMLQVAPRASVEITGTDTSSTSRRPRLYVIIDCGSFSDEGQKK